MKSKIWLILLTLTVVLLLAYSGSATGASLIDGESSTDNVLRVKISTTSPLGSADNFVVLAGAGITNTGTTTISGDVGTYPTTSETGFGSVTLTGTDRAGDAVTQQAKIDLTAAYNEAAGRTLTATVTGNTLGGLILAPGVYRGETAAALSLSGNLTLTGDANAVWIFQAGSTLDTAASSQVILSGGARAANVYWQVGTTATLGESSIFKGNILALTSATLNTGVNVEGRVLALNGAVTLAANTITKPAP